jgi:hypothetical protein
MPEEQKRKISEAHKGKHHSIKTKEKISKSLNGIIRTEEERLKMSLARKGKHMGEYHGGGRRKGVKGVKRSEEAIRSAAMKNIGKKRTEEQRLRMGEAQRKRYLLNKELLNSNLII